ELSASARSLSVFEVVGPGVIHCFPTRRSSDLGVSSPTFSADGKSIRVLVADDRSVYPAEVSLADGKVTRLIAPPIVLSSWDSARSEEHTSELQSLRHLVCRLLLEKRKNARP